MSKVFMITVILAVAIVSLGLIARVRADESQGSSLEVFVFQSDAPLHERVSFHRDAPSSVWGYFKGLTQHNPEKHREFRRTNECVYFKSFYNPPRDDYTLDRYCIDGKWISSGTNCDPDVSNGWATCSWLLKSKGTFYGGLAEWTKFLERKLAALAAEAEREAKTSLEREAKEREENSKAAARAQAEENAQRSKHPRQYACLDMCHVESHACRTRVTAVNDRCRAGCSHQEKGEYDCKAACSSERDANSADCDVVAAKCRYKCPTNE